MEWPLPIRIDPDPRNSFTVARGVSYPTVRSHHLLTCLIAQFERSGIAELRLDAPGFTLVLQAGAEPRIEQRQ